MFVKQPRFFLESLQPATERVIAGEEAHHLLNVLRIQAGEQIVLFDGNGAEFDADVLRVDKRTLTVRLGEARAVERELPQPLTLAVSLPKGDRQKVLVEKLVELGTSTLIPLICRRSVAQPTDSARERLQKQVLAASKQCGRNRLMTIAEPQSLESVLADPTPETLRLLFDPSAAQDFSPRQWEVGPARGVIGPEGGFAPDELELARQKGWSIVGLGPRILRVETAAVAAAVLLGLGRG